MCDYFEYNICSKRLILIKPFDWDLDTLMKIAQRLDLPKEKVVRYIIYYSQKHKKNDNLKISFNEIDNLDNDIIHDLFINYIDSDKQITIKYDINSLAISVESALKAIKDIVENFFKQVASFFCGIYFIAFLYNSWINSIKGELTIDDLNELDQSNKTVLSLYRQNPEYFKTVEFFIRDVKAFNEIKKIYFEFLSRVNSIIEKAKNSDIWIPSRYAKKIFQQLLVLNISELEQIDIVKYIFNQSEEDFDSNIMKNWLNSSMMNGRENIIKESFEAHYRGLYAPSIACLLTQLDFVIFEIAIQLELDKQARNASCKILERIIQYIEDKMIGKKNVKELLPKNSDFSNAIYYYQMKSLVQYLKGVIFEDTKIIKDDRILNRHGILHGKFLRYPSEANSKKLILLIDEMIIFYMNLSKREGSF